MKTFKALKPIYIQKKTVEAGQTFTLEDDVAASFELFLKMKAVLVPDKTPTKKQKTENETNEVK